MNMRGPRVRAAALAGAVLLATAGTAAAVDTVIGGRAGLCATAAKAGHFDALGVESCTVAIAAEPLGRHELAATYVNRGTLFMAAMNWGSAMADFDQAIAIEPQMAEAYVNRGGALIGLKRFKEGEAEIDKGLALMPIEPEKAYGNRALARWSQDNLQGAYDDFKTALALKPDWAWVAEQMAQFTVETRNVSQAPAAGR
jgi:tetratricopeptide (TPR) repeat protein